jgi:hypothetical protein
MGSWWNSLERASSVNNWVLGFAALFGFLAAAFVIAGWFLGARTSELEKAQLAQFQSDAETKIATANQISAQANEHAKQLEKQTTELRNQNLKIQERLEWRVILPSEQAKIIENLKSYKGHAVQIIQVDDTEASAYANNFLDVFIRAGWSFQQNFYSVAYATATGNYGVICRVAVHPDAAVLAVIDALRKAHVSLRTEQVSGQDSFIEIFVGPRSKG